ncbi:YbjN domain-containing protein [Paracrocinitomix mangrovi]|uniref:YbjN domain-containing protein n=1 Tax=Paracrocinitomix mangrovi TaxID=2862509 RepID=UPI001C8DE405|nr:YbjN domain-containing protein [Paracrocinitomix mangrovi]UKN03079.1 YbjN domain-containing protein [Paracrocinitomix mangrovi]
MSLFKKMFGGDSGAQATSESTTTQSSTGGLVSFGRYTDINKNKTQLDAWKNANDRFKEKNYVDSFEQFLIYLRDPQVDNVTINRNGDVVEFEITQGSKVVRGKGDANRFYAEAQIVKMPDHTIPVMRKLMSINYALNYSKFAMKDDVVVMKFSSHAIDASPGKLYDALKELCRKADQQDDLLTQEFSSLEEFDTDSIIELPADIKEAKYEYLVGMIQSTKEEIAKHDPNFMSGGIAFLLLNLTYKIDYLIQPQGELTDALERIQRMFFAKDNKTTQERNVSIIDEFDNIINTPKEKVMEGIYDVKATFALANPATHKSVMDMMFNERDKIGWYRDNNYPQMVEAIYSYMVSYAFFNYGMVYPVSKILNVAMAVMNPDYYEKCGSAVRLNNNGQLDGGKISNEINNIVKDAKKDFPHLAFNTGTLNYTSIPLFIDSLILELDKINLSK